VLAKNQSMQLDNIYIYVLQSALWNIYHKEEERELRSLLRIILGAIAVMFSSLSASSLETLLYVGEHAVEDALLHLQSIYDVPTASHQPIHPLHASDRDFLLSVTRCTNQRFRIVGHQAHRRMARSCLERMDNDLDKDIIYLSSLNTFKCGVSGDKIGRRFQTHLRYACLY
jgi:hypothetical protein